MAPRSTGAPSRSHVGRCLSLALGVALSAPGCIAADDAPGSSAQAAGENEVGAKASYTLFESGQVRPLALSPDGGRLFAVNTPDNRIEVFQPIGGGLRHCGSVPVGLEPVAVAARSRHEVWVVNHLSDSVSVVDIGPVCVGAYAGHLGELVGRVTHTIMVGDEPADLVFAGPGRKRAFVTTAHRGQNAPYDPQLTTPGVGRADVWVFDAKRPADGPLTIVQLFSDTPRALAVSPDGKQVYAAGFKTGNRTTSLFFENVLLGGGAPPPHTNHAGVPQPPAALIVGNDGEHWVDELGRVWDDQVRFDLPDQDVFVIDATADPPRQVAGVGGYYQTVGTTLFNMAVNPVSGRVYVSNTDAGNRTRFEGAGHFAGSTVRGNMVTSRITVLGGGVNPIDLNKHVDPDQCCDPTPNPTSERSLAFPTGMAVTQDGDTLYVAAFGSDKIGVFDTEELEEDSFEPDSDDHIELSGGGPTGIVLDEDRGRAYVLTRFDDAISIIDLDDGEEIDHLPLHNPEPASVVAGRRFNYDARLSSSNGTQACASCHVFGDMDQLAWDLGDPDGDTLPNPGPFVLHPLQVGSTMSPDFAPMKGPMTTQSLRGMANHGPMHWRGDRTGGHVEPSAQPDRGSFSERLAFEAFNPAFVGLNGRSEQLTADEMRAYTDFALQLTYPPNPVRNLDDSLTADQQAGRDFYFSSLPSDTFFNCNGCHVLDRDGNAEHDVFRPGFFGSDGRYSFENLPQVVKVAHLRNMYQKVGMFGMAENSFVLPEVFGQPNAHMGDQIRGFGYLHDGSIDSLERFLSALVFVARPPGTTSPFDPGNPGGFTLNLAGFLKRRQLVQFVLAFDSNLAPVVGQQVTLGPHTGNAAEARADLLRQRAEAGDCDLVAKTLGRGLVYQGGGTWKSDRSWEPPVSDTLLRWRAQFWGGETTLTCAPPGSGVRMGIDRDEDGHLDGNERWAGSDPADPDDTP